MKRLLPIIGVLVLIYMLLLTGCGNDQEAARKKLAQMNIDYTIESFNQAIENKDDQVTKLFLMSGFDVGLKDSDGKTPLMSAAKVDNEDILKAILDKNNDRAKDVDNVKHTALAYAIINKQNSAIDILADFSDWAAVDIDDNTLLHLAIISSDLNRVNIIIDHGVDINSKNKKGKTPLLLAVENNLDDIVKELLEKDADKTIADNSGVTPLKAAKSNKNGNIIKLLGGDDNGNKPALNSSGALTHLCDVKAYAYYVDLPATKLVVDRRGKSGFRETQYWITIISKNKDNGEARTRSVYYSIKSGKGIDCYYAYDSPENLKSFNPYQSFEYNREAVTAFQVSWEYLFHQKF